MEARTLDISTPAQLIKNLVLELRKQYSFIGTYADPNHHAISNFEKELEYVKRIQSVKEYYQLNNQLRALILNLSNREAGEFESDKKEIKHWLNQLESFMRAKDSIFFTMVDGCYAIFSSEVGGILSLEPAKKDIFASSLHASFQALLIDIFYQLESIRQIVKSRMESENVNRLLDAMPDQLPDVFANNIDADILPHVFDLLREQGALNRMRLLHAAWVNQLPEYEDPHYYNSGHHEVEWRTDTTPSDPYFFSYDLYNYYKLGRKSYFLADVEKSALTPAQWSSYILGVYHYFMTAQPSLEQFIALAVDQSSHQLMTILEDISKLAPFHLNVDETVYLSKFGSKRNPEVDINYLQLLLPEYRVEIFIRFLQRQIQLEREFAAVLNDKKNIEKVMRTFSFYSANPSSPNSLYSHIEKLTQHRIQLLSIQRLISHNFIVTKELQPTYEEWAKFEDKLYQELTTGLGYTFNKVIALSTKMELEVDNWLLYGCFQPLLFDCYYLVRNICVGLTAKFQAQLIQDLINTPDMQQLEGYCRQEFCNNWLFGWALHHVQRSIEKSPTAERTDRLFHLETLYIEDMGITSFLHYTFTRSNILTHNQFADLDLTSAELTCFYYCFGRTLDFHPPSAKFAETLYRAYLLGIYEALFISQDRRKILFHPDQRLKEDLEVVFADIEKTIPYQFTQRLEKEFQPYIPLVNFKKIKDSFLNLISVKQLGFYAKPTKQQALEHVQQSASSRYLHNSPGK